MNQPQEDDERRPNGRRPYVSPDPVVAFTPEVMAKYNARVLDPSRAFRVKGQLPLRPTVYLADKVLINPVSEESLGDRLTTVADDLGMALVPPIGHVERRQELVERARDAGHPEPEALFPSMVHLEPKEKRAAKIDSWDVLQAYRASVSHDSSAVRHVALNHLLTSASGPSIGGSPYVMGHGVSGSPYVMGHGIDGNPYVMGHGIGGNPYVMGHGVGGTPYVMGHGVGVCEYGVAGWGGRQPVTWLAKPTRSDFGNRRRPVVAVLDTGIGSHPWFDGTGVVEIANTVLSVPVISPEATGVTMDTMSGELDPDAGHGTFIAGLIHQQCPDANILAVPIMSGDGVVAENDLLEVLCMLAVRQRNAIAAGNADELIDVISLSLGYYHELPKDVSYDPKLLSPIKELGSLGVVTVVAAGNDCTNRPMFPAAFAPHPSGEVTDPDPGCLPVISVGALNPNSTLAMFSNQGDWVKCNRPGAAVVSTYPVTINASLRPTEAVQVSSTLTRETIDPDDFSSGFAVWSGTSFAGPVLAGEIAAQLCVQDLNPGTPEDAVTRGWGAVTACVPELSP